MSGQSVAEMALLTPILLLLLLGTIEIGRFAYYCIEVSNAARAGVQHGSQSLAASVRRIVLSCLSDPSQVEVNSLNVSSVNRCACSRTPEDFVGCPATSCGSGHALVFLEVATTADIRPLFRYPGLPATFAASGKAIMRVAQ